METDTLLWIIIGLQIYLIIGHHSVLKNIEKINRFLRKKFGDITVYDHDYSPDED